MGVTNETRVARTARSLAALSLAAESGDFLGAESELLSQLGVSRPTLRQAAKVIESERLISVRRGTRGGFYAARPGVADVLHAPARYLKLQGATVAHVHAATKLIAEEVGAAAARCSDRALRARLSAFRDRIASQSSVSELIRAETELARLLAQMSGNPAAQLFIEISYTFGRDEHHLHFYQNTEDRQRACGLQRGLCDAVLAGDAEVARLMMQRRSALIGEWLAQGTAA